MIRRRGLAADSRFTSTYDVHFSNLYEPFNYLASYICTWTLSVDALRSMCWLMDFVKLSKFRHIFEARLGLALEEHRGYVSTMALCFLINHVVRFYFKSADELVLAGLSCVDYGRWFNSLHELVGDVFQAKSSKHIWSSFSLSQLHASLHPPRPLPPPEQHLHHWASWDPLWILQII